MYYLIPVMILIAVFGINKSLSEGYYRTIYLFVVIWVFSFVYATLVVIDAPIPNPTEILITIVPLVMERLYIF